MEQNPFTFLNQAIGQMLATNSPAIQTMGLDMFRGLAVIMIAWFGIQNALSTAQGFYGSFHFGQFDNLLLVISFGLGMLTYYSSPIPGMGYSFSELITQEALQLSAQIESNQTQVIADAVTHAEEQLGQPPGEFDFQETLTFLVIAIALAAMQAVTFAVIAYGLVASAVCVLIGPIFIPFFIVPKLDFLFWGWFKAFLGFSFYQVIASAFIFIFAKVLLALLGVIGPIS
ncbi:MAG: type IV secretion system protein, partial [Acidobacteriaceae bacterium]